MAIEVVLVDDHSVLRDGVRLLLEYHKDIKVVDVAGDGDEGVNAVTRTKPDVAVMDISMPGMSGLEATREIARQAPATAVLVLSVSGSPDIVHEALSAGARGYLLKESTGDELVAAVRALAAGRRYLGSGIAAGVGDWNARLVAGNGGLDALTAREREILRLIVAGKSNAETARILRLSARTVETYRARMMEKLQLEDLPALVKFAIRHGITSID